MKTLLRFLIAAVILLSLVAFVELTVGWSNITVQAGRSAEPDGREATADKTSAQGKRALDPEGSKSGKPIRLAERLRDFGGQPSAPNSAGGVDVELAFDYVGSGTIKYLTFEAVPYNAVGDIATSSIGNKSTAKLKYTGPLRATDERATASWRNVWYNHTITEILITEVTIEYMESFKDQETIDVQKRFKYSDFFN